MIHPHQGAPAMPAADPAFTLVCRFMADVLERTIDISNNAAQQRAVRAFVDELRPWMPPVAGPCRFLGRTRDA